MNENTTNILFAAGGTGGHLFPAIAIADYYRENHSNINSIFIGTENRMESELIPKAGYPYVSMPITAFPGKNIKAFTYPLNMIKSISIAKKTVREENIDAVICTGAYLSIPPGIAAKRSNTPLFLMESNIRPGKSIKFLASSAQKIYTTFDDSINYFNPNDKSKISAFGNPIRKELYPLKNKQESLNKLGLENNKKTVLVFGGSLGALSINRVIEANIDKINEMGINLIWQTGRKYTPPENLPSNILTLPFIDDMNTAYSAADLVVCRSGATTVTELAVCQKPSILIPLPSASNDEQRLNAKTLFDSNGAVILDDQKLNEKLLENIKSIITREERLAEMQSNLKEIAKMNATQLIAEDILNNIR